MKLFAPLLLIGSLLAVGCYGQNQIDPATSSTLISGGSISSNSAVLTSGGSWGTAASATCDSAGRCWWSTPFTATQRKPKPKYTLAQVRASAVPIAKARLAPAAYLTLAKSIGLESAGTDEARMLECLDKLSLKPYDADKVDAYLTHKAEAQGANVYWLWKPLRESDEKVVNAANAMGRSPISFSGKRYGQAVPAHALETVAVVLREMPDAVFLVSDYEAKRPDPFLAVTTARLLQEGRVWIVDVWLEPGFGVPEIHFGPVEPAPTKLSTD